MTAPRYITTDPTDSYLNTIGMVPLMTAEEEIVQGRIVMRGEALRALGRELTAGEQRELRRADRAKRRFIEANMRLVVQIAGKFRRQRTACFLELTDLTQFGVFGLNRAIEKFDVTRGYKFCTYAYKWIQQSISRSINAYERQIRLPDKSAECARKCTFVTHRLAVRLGRNPTRAELAEELSVTEGELALIMERGTWAVSLDATSVSSGNSSTDMPSIGSSLPDPRSLERDDFVEHLDLYRQQLNSAIDILSDHEFRLVSRYYGLNGVEPTPLTQLSKELDIHPKHASFTVNAAVRKLARHFNADPSESRIAA